MSITAASILERITRDYDATGILDTGSLLAFHRDTFGPARMEGEDTLPEQPDGVSDEEWSALGDPGKRAIVRERERATKAEADLAAARAATRARPAPPKQATEQGKAPDSSDGSDPTDVAAIVQQAVAAALAPFEEREQQREAEQAASLVVGAVTAAAQSRLHDPSDATTNIDLASLTDDHGRPDAAKITAALDDLVQRKPHLAKVVDDRRRPAPGTPVGGAAPVVSIDERVKATLAQMQAASGVKLAQG